MNFPPHFRSLHSSLFIAFHYLPSPYITFYRRPISLSAHSLLSPVLSSPRPILSSPRPALSPCPRIPPLHTCFPPASSPPLFHTSVFHAPLSAPPFFTPFALLTPLFYTALLYSLPLFTPPSLYLLPPPSLYLLPLFCTRFFTPRQPPQTRPRHRKRQRFLIFQRNFAKSP